MPVQNILPLCVVLSVKQQLSFSCCFARAPGIYLFLFSTYGVFLAIEAFPFLSDRSVFLHRILRNTCRFVCFVSCFLFRFVSFFFFFSFSFLFFFFRGRACFVVFSYPIR